MLKQLADVTELAVLALLLLLVAAWLAYVLLPQAEFRPVRGPDSWGMPAPGWWCWDTGTAAPHEYDAASGDHVCTQGEEATNR